jgi:hypothetical protein
MTPLYYMSGKPALDGEWLRFRDKVEIGLANGYCFTAEWYEEPYNRFAVFVQVQTQTGPYKTTLFLPQGTLARKVE